MDSERIGGGIAQFDLKEFEWYGDDPALAAERQSKARKDMRALAIAWHCDFLVVYVTADDLFSVSPIAGRHRVISENISPIFDIANVIVKQRIKPEHWNRADKESSEYILQRAKQAVIDRVRGMERNNSTIVTYEIWCSEKLVTKGAVPA
jgi:hypothetical protein